MNISTNNYCCGCSACMYTCPAGAISINPDENGFLKAFVNEAECVGCGKCLKVCPSLSEQTKLHSPIKYYAAINRDDHVLGRSSSGGIFSIFAEYIINGGGVVYGCAFDENMSVKHIRINKISDIDKLRRSKYVQSDLNQSFILVKTDLEKGLPVLFSGTPCQIQGLKLFLGSSYMKLLCIDIICHGVPSQGMFKKNIEYWEEKLKTKINQYEFRLKTRDNISNYMVHIGCANGRIINKDYYKDAYYEAFYMCKSYNEMCYNCNYACCGRTGDITIGDYHWAVEHHSELMQIVKKKKYSISCLLVNSQVGLHVLEETNSKLFLYTTEKSFVEERNTNLLKPTARPIKRNTIYKKIASIGYTKWANDYFRSLDYFKHTKLYIALAKVKRKLVGITEKGT